MPISNSGAEGAFGLPQKFPVRETNIPSSTTTINYEVNMSEQFWTMEEEWFFTAFEEWFDTQSEEESE